MATAAAKVLAVTELVENILLRLPNLDLLLAQTVSTQFRDLIRKTTSLQQKLYYESTTTTSDQLPEVNPLLEEVLEFHGYEVRELSTTGRVGYQGDGSTVTISSRNGHNPGQVVLRLMVHGSGGQTEAVKSSWRDMLVADQPCKVTISHLLTGRETFDDARLGEVVRHLCSSHSFDLGDFY